MEKQENENIETGTEVDTGVNETPDTEADVLRSELEQALQKVEVLRQASDDFKDKFLRGRAELDNYRKRSAADAERARAAGLDSGLSVVLRVFDDLERALQVTGEGQEEGIIKGVRLVLDNLLADLERLGIERTGLAGEEFNPELHEALTAIPAGPDHKAGTIAQVAKTGFRQGDRLIRPAAVVVYND